VCGAPFIKDSKKKTTRMKLLLQSFASRVSCRQRFSLLVYIITFTINQPINQSINQSIDWQMSNFLETIEIIP
jgi:hypothetical protein